MKNLQEQYNILNEEKHFDYFHYEEMEEITDKFYGKIPLKYVDYVYLYLKNNIRESVMDSLDISEQEEIELRKLNGDDKYSIKQWIDRNNIKWICLANMRHFFNVDAIEGARKVYGVSWNARGDIVPRGYYIHPLGLKSLGLYSIILLYTDETALTVEELE